MTSAISPTHRRSLIRLDQNCNNDDTAADLALLKQRLDKHLPKYGSLWRNMASARLTKETGAKSGSADGISGISPVNHSGLRSPADDEKVTASTSEGEKENAMLRRCKHQSAIVDINLIDNRDDAKKRAYGDEDDKIIHRALVIDNGGGEESNSTTETLLDAILNKRPVSLRVGLRSSPDHDKLCEDGCDCVDPIIEIINDEDEDASAFDENVDEELADSTDDDGGGECDGSLTTPGAENKNDVYGVRHDESLLSDIDASTDSDSDDSIVMVSRTPKKKRFVLESDEEDQSDIVSTPDGVSIDEDQHKNLEMDYNAASVPNINSLKFNPSERPDHRPQSSKPKAIGSEIFDTDVIEREQEWIELLSSDEEEEALEPPKRTNRVVILSDDDEEESESDNDDNDDHSAFTISDDSGSSEESEGSTYRKSTNKTRSGRRGTPKYISREKPVKEINKPSKTSNNNDARSTLAFRKNRDTLTVHTFSEFNQQAFQGVLSNVKVMWSKKLNKTAGVTRMRGKLGENNAHTRVASIELSTKVIDDEERLRSTLLHEMCHAAQWLVDGAHKPPHGTIFKKWATISMRKIRDVKVTTTHDYQIVYKYAWVSVSFSTLVPKRYFLLILDCFDCYKACTASNCKAVIKRHSRSVDPDKHCCGRCQGKLLEIEVPGSRGDYTKGVSHTPKVARKTSEFALFVKEQTTDVRQRLAREKTCKPKEISQALVMKECGRLWRIRNASSNGESSESDCLESLAERLVEICSIK
jgi:hypothetical protein